MFQVSTTNEARVRSGDEEGARSHVCLFFLLLLLLAAAAAAGIWEQVKRQSRYALTTLTEAVSWPTLSKFRTRDDHRSLYRGS